jgi:hypothetical protein
MTVGAADYNFIRKFQQNVEHFAEGEFMPSFIVDVYDYDYAIYRFSHRMLTLKFSGTSLTSIYPTNEPI